jgi:hypothetical protein
MAYFEFGKSTLQIPEKMIFVNKQGYEKLAPTTTKSGSLTSRFGIRSLNVEPVQDNDINLIKGGVKEYVEIREQKKREKKTKEEKDKKYKDVKKKNKGVDKEVLKYNEMIKNMEGQRLNLQGKFYYDNNRRDKAKKKVQAIQKQIYDYYDDKAENKDLKNRTKPEDLIKEHNDLIKEYSLQGDIIPLSSEKEHLRQMRSVARRYIPKKEEEKPVKKEELSDFRKEMIKEKAREKISNINSKFSALLRGEKNFPEYSSEQLKTKYKNVINDIDNIINEMKKQNINTDYEMAMLERNKIRYMETIDELKNSKKKEDDNYSKITALLIKAKELAKRMEGSEDKERFELMKRITKMFNDANKLDGGNKLKDRMKEVNTIKNIIKNLPPTPSEQLGI